MNEDRFEQNFAWYEWSFVSPEDVPSDDLRETAAAAAGSTAVGAVSSRYGVVPVRDEDWRWTTT